VTGIWLAATLGSFVSKWRGGRAPRRYVWPDAASVQVSQPTGTALSGISVRSMLGRPAKIGEGRELREESIDLPGRETTALQVAAHGIL
jgi:hypothetical protein